MRRDEISKSREQNSQKKLRHFLTNSAAQHVYSLQSTRVVFQSIQWHVNSLTRYANELANDERDEACSSGAFRNLKLSDFLKKGRRRHNDEKTDRTDWFLQPFSTWNQSINAICVHQSGENTDRSVRSRNQTSFCLMLFDWTEILSSRTLFYHHLYVLTSSFSDVLETAEKKSYFKEKLLLEGAESDSEDTSWIISGSFCRMVFVTFKLTDCKSSSVSQQLSVFLLSLAATEWSKQSKRNCSWYETSTVKPNNISKLR